jgi:uncharacterized membrane protein YcaP (DUF421 family)
MESVFRGLIVYVFLFIVFRVAGKRTLAQMTPFDLVLTLIISETVQQALVDSDHSLTNAFLLVLTLVGTAILLSILKQKSPIIEKLLDSVPVLVIEKGETHRDRMERIRVDDSDIISSGRQQQGLKSLDEIDFAVVENDGKITVIPKQRANGKGQTEPARQPKPEPGSEARKQTRRKTGQDEQERPEDS